MWSIVTHGTEFDKACSRGTEVPEASGVRQTRDHGVCHCRMLAIDHPQAIGPTGPVGWDFDFIAERNPQPPDANEFWPDLDDQCRNSSPTDVVKQNHVVSSWATAKWDVSEGGTPLREHMARAFAQKRCRSHALWRSWTCKIRS